MTWAEFRIRSFAFKRQRKWEMHLTREISYEIHTLKYMFGKTRPPKKDKFWPIEERTKPKISEKQRELMRRAYEQYKEQKDADSTKH